MQQKRVTYNYFFNLVNQLLIVAIPVVTTPYLSRVLGVDGVGLYSYTYSIVSYFVLMASLGSGAYAQREIAARRNDRIEVSGIFVETIMQRLITSLIAMAVYAYMVLRGTNLDIKLCAIQGMHIIAVAVDISWLFNGLEEFKKIVFRNIGIKLCNLMYIFIFVKSKEDLYVYVFGYALFILLGNVSLWVGIKNYIYVDLNMFMVNPFQNLRTNIELFVPNVAIQIYTVLDKTMIGMYSVGNFENGYYEQSEKIVKVCLTIITSLGTVIAPRIAYVHANNDNDKLKTYISKSYRFVFFLGIPMCVGMIALADMIVPWFLGAGYEKCILLIRIFSPLLVIIGMSNVTGVQYLVPVKKQNILTVSVSIGAIVNLIINMCLIPRFYSIGASIATIIAESVITIMQLIYVSKLDKIINLSSLVKPFLRYLINGAVMLVVVMWVKRYLVATFIDTLVLAIIGAVIYVLLLTVEKDEFVLEGINVARRMFNKIKRYMRTLVI